MKKIISGLFILFSILLLSSCSTNRTRSDLYDAINDFELNVNVLENVEFRKEMVMEIHNDGNHKELYYDEEEISFSIMNDDIILLVELEFESDTELYLYRAKIQYINLKEEVAINLAATMINPSQLEIESIEEYAEEIYKLSIKDIEWILNELGYDEFK